MEGNKINTEVLNDLIAINNDRIVGYEKAIEELKEGDADLRSMFGDLSGQSVKIKTDLIDRVKSMGAAPETGTTNSGKIYRTWIDVKAIFTGNDRKSVLENCEFGEDAAQKAYQMALQTEGLSAELVPVLIDQKTELRASHDKIRSLRDLQNHTI